MARVANGSLGEMQRDLAAILGRTADTAEVSVLFAKYGCSSVTELRGRIDALRRTEYALKAYTDLFERMRGESWFVFMNHGYLAPDDELATFPPLRAEDEPWRHQIFLYFHLMMAARALEMTPGFADCELLDVGCGRGGGLAALRRYFGLKRAAGIDLNPLHVGFCQDRYADGGLEVMEGNALDIPFQDASFDIVINVESSHCYPDAAAFAAEARRVLRPGGLLLLTDTRDAAFSAPLLDLELLASGMRLLHRRDITDRVRAACLLDAERFRSAFKSDRAEFPRSVAEEQARRYASGTALYVTYVLEK